MAGSERRLTLTDHARWQASRRGLDERDVLEIAGAPEQVIQLREDREVRQSRRSLPPDGKEYLVRVIVETGTEETTVVTAYRTSKIGKYWRSR